MGSQRAARFRDNVRFRLPRLCTDILERAQDGGGVLPRRVVHRAVRARSRALVVDPEAAAHIQHVDGGAERAQLGVEACRLAHAAVHVADVGDLRAQVEVQHLHAVEMARPAQRVERAQDLPGGEAELGALAAGVLPLAGTDRGQANAQADARRHVQRRRLVQHDAQLGELLDDDVDPVTELLADQRAPDVGAVLVAVADDHRPGRGDPEHGRQFRLAAGLEPDARAAGAHDAVHHAVLLVDLDRVDRGVRAVVAECFARLGEGAHQRGDAIGQDVAEAQQHGQLEPFLRQAARELGEVDGGAVGTPRSHQHMPAVGDVDVAFAPFGDVVEGGRVGRAPGTICH